MSTPPLPAAQRWIHEQILAVRAEVGAIDKGDTNKTQGWQFRSYAAVINKVAPATLAAGVNITPELVDLRYDTIQVGNPPRAASHAIVTVRYTLTCDGDPKHCRVAVVPGEAFDYGDKAVSKAMTVAYRTALVQLLQIPFDSDDPDHDVYERAQVAAPVARTVGPSWAQRIAQATTMDVLRGIWDDAVADGLTDAVLPDGTPLVRAVGARKKELAAAAAHEAMLASQAADGAPQPDPAQLCEVSPGRDKVLDRLAALGDIDAMVAECYGLAVAQVSTARLAMLAEHPGELLPSRVWTGA